MAEDKKNQKNESSRQIARDSCLEKKSNNSSSQPSFSRTVTNTRPPPDQPMKRGSGDKKDD